MWNSAVKGQILKNQAVTEKQIIGYLFQNMYTYNAKLNHSLECINSKINRYVKGSLYLERHSNLRLDQQFVTWNWLSTKTSFRFYINFES